MSALPAETAPSRVVRAPLFRVQRGLRLVFQAQRPRLPKKPVPKAARMLAMGHRYLKAIEEGEFEDFADLARRLKVSRAWISMCVELAFLAPWIQEKLLLGSFKHLSIHKLIYIARQYNWDKQHIALRPITDI